MKVPVIYSDGSSSVVDIKNLDALIKKRAIQSFRRSDGWVRVGRDPIRCDDIRNSSYGGVERRKENS